MQQHEYASTHHHLGSESELFQIPFRKEWLLDWIGRGRRVLDVGCLGGQLTRLIMEQNNDVWAVEINEESAKVAERRGVRVRVADVEKGLPFETKGFDVVHAGELVEHLYDTKYFFEEVARVLRPDGSFLFSVPNLNSLENRLKVLTGGYLAQVGTYPEDEFGGHIRIFNQSKIAELCRLTGFEVEKIRGIPMLRPVPKWLKGPAWVVGTGLPRLAPMLLIKARLSRRFLSGAV